MRIIFVCEDCSLGLGTVEEDAFDHLERTRHAVRERQISEAEENI